MQNILFLPPHSALLLWGRLTHILQTNSFTNDTHCGLDYIWLIAGQVVEV